MNQFSESLLTLPETFNVWSWTDLDNISRELFDALAPFDPDGGIETDYEGQKALVLCFILAMSDQDLHECLGLSLPATSSKENI